MDLIKNLRTKPPTYEDAVAAANEIERLREILLKIKQESNDDHVRAWAHQALQQKETE